MIACTLNSLVNVQDVSISKLWWEIHKQVMAGNSTFLWFHHLTANVIVSSTSCVFYSIKHYLHLYTICAVLSKLIPPNPNVWFGKKEFSVQILTFHVMPRKTFLLN